MAGSETEHQSESSNTKVARIIREYDLTGLGTELEEYWLGVEDERMSLRALADYANVTLLSAVLDDAAAQVVDGEAENLYRLLTADDVSAGARVEAEHKLREHDVDIDQLRRDFVSHQAIHTYLTDDRGVTYESPDADEDSGPRLDVITKLRTRLEAVTETTVGAHHDAADSMEAIATIRLQCVECGEQYEVEEFLASDGCQCNAT